MNVNELMLHDYVRRLKHGTNKEYEILGIKVLNASSKHHIITNTADGKFIPEDWRIEDLEPVPLTQELLEKNGWEFSSSNSTYMLHVKFNEFALVPQKNGSFNIKQLNFIKNIEYVHELQQALRFFGDYELANNFKI